MLRSCTILAAALLLFPITAPAADEPAQMAPVIVTAPADSLHVAASDSATLLAADPAELPLSVEVLPQALLDQRYVTTVYDSLEQSSGVFTGGKSSFTVSSGKPSIRGYGGNDVLLDGMALPARLPIFLDAAGLSGIEIFKGPLNSTLGGQSGLQGSGGGVNLVGKTPDFNGTFLRLSLGSTFGNGESVRFTADPNQVLSDALAVRAPLALTCDQPFYLPGGVDGDWTVAAAPSVAWKPGEHTTLTLAISWLQTDRAAYQGIPNLKGDFLVPLDTYYGTDDTRDEFTGVAVQFRADHEFSEALRLSVGGGYARADEERSHWSVSPNPVAADGMTTLQYYDEVLASRTARFSYTDGDHLDENLSAFARLAWTVETGPVVHQLAGGADWLRRESSSESSMGSTGWQSLDHPDLSAPSMSPGIASPRCAPPPRARRPPLAARPPMPPPCLPPCAAFPLCARPSFPPAAAPSSSHLRAALPRRYGCPSLRSGDDRPRFGHSPAARAAGRGLRRGLAIPRPAVTPSASTAGLRVELARWRSLASASGVALGVKIGGVLRGVLPRSSALRASGGGARVFSKSQPKGCFVTASLAQTPDNVIYKQPY
jgi:hypothetical protein